MLRHVKARPAAGATRWAGVAFAGRWLCVLASSLSPAVALAATDDASIAARSRFSVAPASAWVETIATDTAAKPRSERLDGGIYYLLADRQVRVSGGVPESYGHYAKLLVNASGLEGGSQVSIDFDPSYQRMTLHAVRVWRAGQWRNRLQPGAVKLLQRESDLESQIYDGSVSAVLFVEDLRVGDVLEYAYTIAGSNPTLGGHYLDAFSVEWSVPLHHMRFRILWPSERRLCVRNHRTTVAAVTRERGPFTESTWELRDVAPVSDPASAPAWFDAYGWVQLSEFESWAQVAEWGRGLFQVPAADHPRLEAQVASWRGKPRSEAALAALRFVQDEVRYLGIELGAGAHKPSPPALVLRRRYGDCKDKALLFCALLRQLGVEAHPALVHSSRGPALGEWQPSPYAFNHVVVRIDLGERRLWLDPTLTAQGGSLPEVWFPRYAQALVLEPGSEDLTPISPSRRPLSERHVQETYAVKDFKSPAEYVVLSAYRGSEADRMRRELRDSNREDISENYLKYYSRIWPGIDSKGSLELSDDREANVLTTIERYSIPSFWDTAKHRDRPEVELWAGEVGSALPNPARTERWAPLAVAFPLHVRQSTSLDLPEEWDLEPKTTTVEDGAVRFRYRASREGRTLTLDYDYETLAGTVSAGGFPRHLETLDAVRDCLHFRLRRPLIPGGPSGRANWVVLSVLGGFGLFAALGAVLVYRYQPAAPVVARIRAPSLQGIRGWLLVFALFLGVGIMVEGIAVLASWGDYSLGAWLERTTPSADGYLPAWAPLLLVTLISRVALLAAGASVLGLLLRKRRTLPAAYVAFVILQAALLVVVALLEAHVPERRQGAGEAVAWALLLLGPACLWIPYLFLSDRARSTLVRP